MNKISSQEYTSAIVACINLALQPTGGGRVAAQAILSAHNGDFFQLDVSGLCYLDRGNYEIILNVIRGRYDTRREPYEMIADGNEVFRALWKQWEGLEIAERAKRDCPDCDGTGKIYPNSYDYDDMASDPCIRCSGTGRICRCK